jgi:beta-phosphoglucomutase-like phosphatase (HAD superfamily)
MVLTVVKERPFKTKLKAAIFDLDGVVTQTRDLHIRSWKKLFDGFLADQSNQSEFTVQDYIDHVDGRPRYDGVQQFLSSRNITLPRGTPSDKPWDEEDKQNTTICGLGNRKDQFFAQELKDTGAVVYDSTVKVIKDLKRRGVLLGVGSSSKNCVPVLKQAGLYELFDAIVDGVMLEKQNIPGKPKPDMFLRSLELVCKNTGNERIPPELAMLSEDAIAGVEAGEAGKFGLVIGVNRAKNSEELAKHSHVVVDDFVDITTAQLNEWFGAHKEAL